MHQKIKFIPMKIHATVATRAAVFGPDMQQIVCRLGLRPRPHWVSLQRSPRPLAGFKGSTFKGRGYRKGGEGPTYKGGRRREGRGGEKGGSPVITVSPPDLGVLE